jgi:hypothetical protein
MTWTEKVTSQPHLIAPVPRGRVVGTKHIRKTKTRDYKSHSTKINRRLCVPDKGEVVLPPGLVENLLASQLSMAISIFL